MIRKSVLLRHAAWAVGVCATCSCPGVARGQTSNSALAEALYESAIKLMEEGKDAEACPKLQQSQELESAVGTLLYLGLCYERTGKTASAWAAYRAAGEAGRKANQPERQKMALEFARKLEPKLSRITIVMAQRPANTNFKLLLDGIAIGNAALGVPVPVDPGVHEITVTAVNMQPWTHQFDVAPNDTRLTVTIPRLVPAGQPLETEPAEDAIAAPRGRPEAAPAPETRQNASLGPQRTLALVAGGAGLLGLAVGTYAGLRVNSKEDEASEHCVAYPTGCDAQGLEANAAAQDASTWSTVGFVAGGALLVGGLVLWVSAPSSEPAPGARSLSLQPAVSREAGGLWMTGVW